LKQNFDVLIAGAGFAGGVCARVLAEKGKQVLVAERRSHTGGNAYDCKDQAGVLIHQYGPHIFHTNDKKVFDFLSRFTKWRRYQHKVIANLPRDNPEVVPAHKTTNGRFFFPVPFNLDSLKNAFGAKEGDRLGKKLLDAYPAQSQVTILELRQNPDPEIAAIADYVYEHVFIHYTMKQWGQTPEEIDPNTTARVPVRLSTDDRYFQDAYQGMPLEGYTAMFERMLDHPNIQVRLNTDARPLMKDFPGTMIYTGQADELFGFKYGPLPYRTLDFQFETVQKDHFQAAGTVNYTVDEAYTRITEFKLLTGQALPGVTTIMKEYSRAYTGEPGETPYYAIINPENNALYSKYQADARKIPNLHLLGRLAEYKYYNMDAIAARALALAEQL